jgi:hypothetical protein
LFIYVIFVIRVFLHILTANIINIVYIDLNLVRNFNLIVVKWISVFMNTTGRFGVNLCWTLHTRVIALDYFCHISFSLMHFCNLWEIIMSLVNLRTLIGNRKLIWFSESDFLRVGFYFNIYNLIWLHLVYFSICTWFERAFTYLSAYISICLSRLI